MKKIITSIFTLFLAVLVTVNSDLTASAAFNQETVNSNHIQTVFRVRNHNNSTTSADQTSTNIGGVSAGTANNRLFVVKSNNDEVYGTLYYFNNVYDERFATGEKLPKRITFAEGLLGHANAMAVDDKYIYVTKWTDNGTEKNDIIRISRTAISLLSDEAIVSSANNSVTNSSGETIPIYTIYQPKKTDGTNYTGAISAITRYSYDKTNEITKFIIRYNNANNDANVTYTIATLKNGVFTVSTNPDDMFEVETGITNVTQQDIFYDYDYGLMIPMWVGGTNGKTQNYILFVNIRDLKNTSSTKMVFQPYKTLYFNKTSDANGTLTKFEIESVAFIKRDENKEDIPYRLLFSCNKADASGTGCDSIEEITPLSNYVTEL